MFLEQIEQTIRTNPSIQRLIIDYCETIGAGERFQFIDLIAEHLNNIKELVLDIGIVYVPPLDLAIDKVVNSFKRLESLSIHADENLIELMDRLAKECKGLKHLGLFGYDYQFDNETVRSFQQLKSLCLAYRPIIDPIHLPLDHLPNLRNLDLELGEYNNFINVLQLFRKCESLQKIAMIFTAHQTIYPKDFITANFFKEFIETITATGKSNLQIVLKLRGEIIAIAAANGIIWRKYRVIFVTFRKFSINSNT